MMLDKTISNKFSKIQTSILNSRKIELENKFRQEAVMDLKECPALQELINFGRANNIELSFEKEEKDHTRN